mmetsp:Transcript_30374/g.69291  ORF Transcript_30374/g.69291 Transcript_30374/m.69291 type:complete len:317 (+) Transcript_30374:3-953(+)
MAMACNATVVTESLVVVRQGMTDLAYRRLLLEQVESVVRQPPSASALVELLRIATPSLRDWDDGDGANGGGGSSPLDAVRDGRRRERLFRTLRLRIHPDKHAGGERATALFQRVGEFYEECVAVVEADASGDGGCNGQRNQHWTDDGRGRTTGDGREFRRGDGTSWYFPGERRGGARTKTSRSSGGPFDYSQFHEDGDFRKREGNRNTRRRRAGGNASSAVSEPRRPPTHQALAVISSVLFFPLGLPALLHSVRVKRAWDEGRLADARDHSDNARAYAWYALLCFGAVVAYVWLGDGDLDWDWERIKRNVPWDNGP